MDTPVCDFCRKYAASRAVRLHMPGHKGKTPLTALDITEIDGADVLYSAKGIIASSEKNASTLFKTAKTLYSAEGSTLAIRAMLYLARALGGNKFLAAKNAHRAFITSAALLGLDVDFISGENLLKCEIDPAELEKRLSRANYAAVYVTSPDYLGNIADVRSLSAVCKKHRTPLIVDNAHGAYLKFITPSMHPIDLGADMCADSAHKTLSALTGAAYLHVSRDSDPAFSENAESALSLFASTSPSYLILQSLDRLNAEIADGTHRFTETQERVKNLKNRLIDRQFSLVGDEPFKITIYSPPLGYTGYELKNALKERGIFVEFADRDYLVAMISTETAEAECEGFFNALTEIPRKPPITEAPPAAVKLERPLTLREAMLAKKTRISIDDAEGEIFADFSAVCPPAVAPIIPGEKISREAVSILGYYGYKNCLVVKK